MVFGDCLLRVGHMLLVSQSVQRLPLGPDGQPIMVPDGQPIMVPNGKSVMVRILQVLVTSFASAGVLQIPCGETMKQMAAIVNALRVSPGGVIITGRTLSAVGKVCEAVRSGLSYVWSGLYYVFIIVIFVISGFM